MGGKGELKPDGLHVMFIDDLAREIKSARKRIYADRCWLTLSNSRCSIRLKVSFVQKS